MRISEFSFSILFLGPLTKVIHRCSRRFGVSFTLENPVHDDNVKVTKVVI